MLCRLVRYAPISLELLCFSCKLWLHHASRGKNRNYFAYAHLDGFLDYIFKFIALRNRLKKPYLHGKFRFRRCLAQHCRTDKPIKGCGYPAEIIAPVHIADGYLVALTHTERRNDMPCVIAENDYLIIVNLARRHKKSRHGISSSHIGAFAFLRKICEDKNLRIKAACPDKRQ